MSHSNPDNADNHRSKPPYQQENTAGETPATAPQHHPHWREDARYQRDAGAWTPTFDLTEPRHQLWRALIPWVRH